MRNLNKPPRYNVASIQAQQTLGGDVMQSHDEGQYVEWRDYQWLLTEKQRLDSLTAEMDKTINASQAECRRLKAEVEKWEKNTQLMGRQLNDELEQVARLKAEVENSKRINTELLALSNRQASDIRRMTKAGDALAYRYATALSDSYGDGTEEDAMDIFNNPDREELVNWNAAKEGKQSK